MSETLISTADLARFLGFRVSDSFLRSLGWSPMREEQGVSFWGVRIFLYVHDAMLAQLRATVEQCQQANGVITLRQNDKFGLCPFCLRTDGYVNDAAGAWMFCLKHKVRWRPLHELPRLPGLTDDSIARNDAAVAFLPIVDPVRWPEATRKRLESL